MGSLDLGLLQDGRTCTVFTSCEDRNLHKVFCCIIVSVYAIIGLESLLYLAA